MMKKSNFGDVKEKPDFSAFEEEILLHWDKIDAFKTQLKKTEGLPEYTFYDGPPFATGLPHYGHITAGTIKDVVTRYWTQNGFHVDRKFGWDCHGLPIECIINKQLKIDTKKQLLELGIEKYNKACRDIVMQYSNDWKYYTKRLGRWIDFDNDYKTMDLSFMESVWWVFKQIFDKGRVYRKCKVMPYSPACNTVLSNFEAGMNYQDINDPSVYVSMPLIKDPNVKIIVWTTTPWTLISNLACAVNPTFDYVYIKVEKKEDKQFLIAECLLKDVAKKLKFEGKYEVLKKCKGKDLEGIEYEPLFKIYYDAHHSRGGFRIVCADYVTNDSGTGVVHIAPTFGEEDYTVGIKYNLMDQDRPPNPYDDDGNCTDEFPLCAGKNFKVCDKVVLDDLKSRGRLLLNSTAMHKYPMCYRTDTPLMQKAIPSWFIKIKDDKLKEDLMNNNTKAKWVPEFVQNKRFANWLADAKDWCFSRNRCWGNPIPIWVSDDYEEMVCVGSIKELEDLSGVKNIKDLHREFIDKITIPSKKGKGNLKRIEEVFDCWFESGSMPYAQVHYPFSMNEEQFMKRFPGDFIAEGVDQTRGWFYTLNVISTILFNTNPFKNLIVNGLVLDEKGRKLSKSLGNFEDPKIFFAKYGSDAIRLYLINSGLVRGQNLKFVDKGLMGTVKDIFLPLYNSYRFLIQNLQRYETSNNANFEFHFDYIKRDFNTLNITDRWIIAYNQRLIKFVRTEMEGYRLYTVVSELLTFLDKLTNWYIRLNRGRLKGDYGIDDCFKSLNVLFSVMLNLIILLSPFIPFQTEYIYQNLKNGLSKKSNLLEESIHFLRIPLFDDSLLDLDIEETMKNMITVIDMGRLLRDQNNIPLKKPLASIEIINFNQSFLDKLHLVEYYIQEELNVIEVTYNIEEEKFIKFSCKSNSENLFKKSKELKEVMKEEQKEDDPEMKKELDLLQKEANKYMAVIKKLTTEDLKTIVLKGSLLKDDITVTLEHILLDRKFLPEFEKDKVKVSLSTIECGIRADTTSNDNIMNIYYCRDFTNKIQKFRKEVGINISDDIIIVVGSGIENAPKSKLIFANFADNIQKVLKVPFLNEVREGYSIFKGSEFTLCEDEKVTITIYKRDVVIEQVKTKQKEQVKEDEQDDEEDGDDGDDKKGNKSEKKVRKALGKLGMTKVHGVNRVTVKPKDNNILIIKDAEVFSSKDVENTFIIFGELTFDEPDKKAAKEELQKFTKEGTTLQNEGVTTTEKPKENIVIEEEDPNAEVNAAGLDESAIQTVMEEGNCSKAKAVKILRSTDGDVVAALLKLTDN